MENKDLHLKGFTIINSNMRVNVHLKELNKNLQKAQFALDTMVMTSMLPFMPQNTGTFKNNTVTRSDAMAGSGWVCAGAGPMGRYLYYGKLMVDPDTGSPWAKKDAKKIIDPQNRPLNYSNPKAVPKWFEAAKEKYGKQWIETVSKKLGGR